MHLTRATAIVVVASASCNYAIAPAGQSFAAEGGSGTISLTAGSGCPWAAQPNADWISLNSASNGSGSVALQFTVASNKWAAPRTASITIADAPPGPVPLVLGWVHAAGDTRFV